jgi:hypothetical protein
MTAKPPKSKTSEHVTSSSEASSQVSGASGEARNLLKTASKMRKGTFSSGFSFEIIKPNYEINSFLYRPDDEIGRTGK